MSEHRITIRAVLEGEEGVKGGFRRMGGASSDMAREIKFLGREMAILGSSVHAVGMLGEQFGILNKEQSKVLTTMGSMMALSGSVVRALGYLADTSKLVALTEHARGAAHAFADAMAAGIHRIAGGIISVLHAIASSSVMVALAEGARAVAHAIANAVASMGVAVPIMIAAAAAAAIGVGAYTGAIKIPGLAEGGVAYNRTLAWVGEREPEVIMPLSTILNTTSNRVENNRPVNVYIQNPTFRSRDDMDYMVKALRRGVE